MPVLPDHLRHVHGHVPRERGAVHELAAHPGAALAALLVDFGRTRERAEEEAAERVVEGIARVVEREGLLVDGLLQRLVLAVVARAEAQGAFEREAQRAVRGSEGRDARDAREDGVRRPLAQGLQGDAQGQHVGGPRDVEGIREARLRAPDFRRRRRGRLVRLPHGLVGRHAAGQPQARRQHGRDNGKSRLRKEKHD